VWLVTGLMLFFKTWLSLLESGEGKHARSIWLLTSRGLVAIMMVTFIVEYTVFVGVHDGKLALAMLLAILTGRG
jgi:hypothetical protein